MRYGRGLIIAALAFVSAGCGMGLIPGDPAMPPGSREWIVTVQNDSNAPAVLSVAEDTVPVGDAVGTVRPSSVPPNSSQDVVFTVPPGDGWAIFVNPSRERGPLIIPHDVPPEFSGRLPITIFVAQNGEPSAGTEGRLGPGWFGN